MGYDKFVSFLSKNLSNKCYDEIYPKENIEGSVISKYIYYDINFIIYKCINNVEDNINELLRVIYCIEKNKDKKFKKYIESCFLSKYFNLNILLKIKDIDNKIIILKKEIDKVINIIVYNEILNYILFSTYSIHKPYFIKNVLIFFDGIPGYSKILEQRKRRIFNYLNSNKRKKYYNEYFSNDFSLVCYDEKIDIKYDYFRYIKNTYNVNKNFGPQSEFLNNLSLYLKDKLSNGNRIKIYINDSNIPGEADYKILKHIEENKIKGDICIHSCDSDFLYFIILYQLKNQNDYVNLNLIKYSNNSYQSYSGKKLIELFTAKYKNDNNINNNIVNLNFLYDIMFIIQLFGNDLIPDNFELSVEINLSIIFNSHYKLYNDDNFIININDEKTINFNNLLIFLKEISNYNLFTMNLLGKFFKIPKKMIYIISKDLKYNIKDFISKLIIPYLKYEAYLYKDDLDNDDIRYKYINHISSDVSNGLNNNPIDDLNLDKDNINYLKENIKYIFDYTNEKDNGLIRLTTNFEVCDNPYQSLYNYIVINSVIETNKSINKSFSFDNLINSYEEYLKYTDIVDVYNYFEIIENQTKILFYDFSNYKPTSKVFCKYNMAPSIKNIIQYLQYNDYYSTPKVKYNDMYFDKISHHLFITPYLLDNLSFLEDSDKYTNHIMSIMNYHISNIFNIEDINLRDINPDIFLDNINQLIKMFEDSNIKLLYTKYNILL